MERYLDAARKISRLAVGDPAMPVMVNIHRLDPEHPQDERVDDLPFGTRGGIAIRSEFPVDGTYVVKVELAGGAARAAAAGGHHRRRSACGCRHWGRGRRPGGSAAAQRWQAGPPENDVRVPARARRRGPSWSAWRSCSAPRPATRRRCGRARAAAARSRRSPRSRSAVRTTSRRRRDSPSRRRIFVCGPTALPRRRGARVRAAHPVDAGAPRLPASGDRRRRPGPDAVLRGGPRRGQLRSRHPEGDRAAARQPAVPVSHRARAGDRRGRPALTASAISSWPRGCRSSSGAASRTTSCWTWRRRDG